MMQDSRTQQLPWVNNLGEIILASGSPRRRELLENAGVSFLVQVSGCDETPISGESPTTMVTRLALEKAKSVASANPSALILAADTTVCIDGECLGKPDNEVHAAQMLQTIQGRTHEVLGGVALVSLSRSIEIVKCYSTQVTMRAMTKDEIDWYVKTTEPMDKAGSYAIQGIGLQFVESIQGSYSNVVGLDIAEVMALLKNVALS